MRNFRNLTLDVGNNPHVDGIRWYGNNSSILQNVRVTGTGRVGINAGFLGQNGPSLIQDALVEGSFETGIRCAWSWGQTLSRVTVRNARQEGVYVNATAVGIEDLVVENTPVALRNEYPNDWTWWGGVVALVGGRFRAAIPNQPAITNTSVLYARNVTSRGVSSRCSQHHPGRQRGRHCPRRIPLAPGQEALPGFTRHRAESADPARTACAWETNLRELGLRQ
jgi:hypothetical protein